MIGAPRTNLQHAARSSNIGVTDAVQQSVLRSVGRKSMASMGSIQRSNNNNNNNGHRASSFGLNSLSLSQTQSKDPRPLRDRNFQLTMQQDILDFLNGHNFEYEMKHSLSQKSLKNPTQKDFVMVFQFLYKKIDPGYRFTKSIENEVYYVLKNISYPYLESINKSQISAVGGQNWCVFLGVLHWLVELIGKLEISLIDNESKQSEDNELELEKIFVNYIIKSYNAFLNNIDDYSVFYNEMGMDYDEYTKNMINGAQSLKSELQLLKETNSRLVNEVDSFEQIEKKSQALESDLFKFKAYIESMEKRKLKWGSVLEQIKQEMTNSENDLRRTEQEKNQLQKQITEQGLTSKDIDRINNERDRISKSIDAVNQRLNEISKTVHTKELEAQHLYESLSNALKEYNFSIYSIASSITDLDASKFVIKLDNLLSDDKVGKNPEELLNGQNIKEIKQNLINLKSEINVKIHSIQDETINVQESIDSVHELLNEKSEQIESLEAKLSASKIEYEELYENMTKEATSYHTEIEKFENELKAIQSSSRQNISLLDQHAKTVDMEYNKLKTHINQEREGLYSKAQNMMDKVITFKLNIQGALEDLENTVVDEIEKQRHGA
jgi:kinetochore protein NDC80